jgi:peptidoglycan/LPS O-acetylase OafA/YrhL
LTLESNTSPALQHRREIPALTGLRFVAAFSVAVAHGVSSSIKIDHPSPLLQAIHDGIVATSGVGMSLFFILSGFVIHYNYRMLIFSRGLSGFAEFLWARISRLYPLFAIILLADLLFGLRTYNMVHYRDPSLATSLKALPYYLTFTQSWFYSVAGDRNLMNQLGTSISVAWSVSTEWFFYLCYPAVLLLVVRVTKPSHALGVAMGWSLVWGTFASGLATYQGDMIAWAANYFGAAASQARWNGDSFFYWLFYLSPYLRIGEFILGCIVAQLYLTLEDKKIGCRERSFAWITVIVVIVSLPALIYVLFWGQPVSWLSWLQRLNYNYGPAPAIAILLFCAARYDFGTLRWLSARPIIRLGEASYSIYLTHLLVFTLICNAEDPLPDRWGSVIFVTIRLVAMLAFVLLISMGLYTWVEDPARRRLRTYWRRNNSSVFPSESERRHERAIECESGTIAQPVNSP